MHLKRMIESKADGNLRELKKQYREQGYLFFRNLIPRKDIASARRAILERLVELKRAKSIKDPSIINGKFGVALFEKAL